MNTMCRSVLLIVLLDVLIFGCYNTESLLSSKMSNSRDFEAEELIKCTKFITDSLIAGSAIILFEEEIRHVPWINAFLKHAEKSKIIVSFDDENIPNLFGLYILFPEYQTKNALRFWNNHVKSRFLAVWINATSSTSLQTVFERFWSNRCTSIIGLARLESDRDLKLHSFSAYSEGECGFVRMNVVDEWNRTTESFGRDLNYYENNAVNFHKCVLKVLCNHKPPDSIMNVNYETYGWDVSGVSEKLLEIAEKYFNFTSSIHAATLGINLNHSWYYYTEELDFICDTVNREIVDFAVGWFSYSAIEMDNLDSRGIELATVTSIDCFGWAVPLRAGVRPSNSAYFTKEFGYETWILIFLLLCSVSLGLYCILRKSVSVVSLIAVQTCLEQPVPYQSTSRKSSFRILFLNFCFCSLVVSAAYKASFASFITVSFHGEDFSNVKEIIESPLKLYGSPNMLRILNATTSGSRIQAKKLLRGFNVLPPGDFEDVMNRVIRQRDIAVFGVKRNMYYHAIGEAKNLKMRIPFRFIPGCLIRPHTTHFLFKRGSFLIRPFNRLLNRLFETGIASHWILHLGSNRVLPAERLKGRNLRIQFFRTPFYVLLFGYAVSCSAFVVELVYHRVMESGNERRVRTHVARRRWHRNRCPY